MKIIIYYTCTIITFFSLSALEKTESSQEDLLESSEPSNIPLKIEELEHKHYLYSLSLAFQDEGGCKDLHEANISGVKKMLSTREYDINAQDELGWTPLILAIYIGNEEIISLLLESPDSDLYKKDIHGKTAHLWTSNKSQTKQLADRILVKMLENPAI